MVNDNNISFNNFIYFIFICQRNDLIFELDNYKYTNY